MPSVGIDAAGICGGALIVQSLGGPFTAVGRNFGDTDFSVLVAVFSSGAVRVTQDAIEVAGQSSKERVTQQTIEAVVQSSRERVTQQALEMAVQSSIERVTQQALEILWGPPPLIGNRVTQQAIEIVSQSRMARITQQALELVGQSSKGRVTQHAMEVVWGIPPPDQGSIWVIH